MKKQHFVWLLILISVAAALFYLIPKAHVESRIVKIGAILPLTGDGAQYGRNDKDGIDLAIQIYNSERSAGQPEIKLYYEDCGTDAGKAISAMRKLRADGVSLFIDNAMSSISLALAPLLEPEESTLISTGASNPKLSGISPYFFRVWNSDTYEGEFVAKYLRSSHSNSRLAMIYVNNDYGAGLVKVVRSALEDSDILIVGTEAIPEDGANFRNEISRISEMNPSHIYLVGYAAQTGLASRQIREAGLDSVIIGTVAMEDAEYLKLSGDAAEGVIYPFPVAPTGSVVETFKAAFTDKYNKEPQILNDVGYDAASLLSKAVVEGNLNGKAVRKYLRNMPAYQGASGMIQFDEKGDVHKPMQMKIIKDGSFSVIND